MNWLANRAPLFPAAWQSGSSWERDHRIAERLQRLLLRASSKESLPGVCVETFCEAALDEARVGGDSCDAFALTGGRTVLSVVDASGKGLSAAERVIEIRFALRAFLREHGDPRQVMSCLNNFVCDSYHLSQKRDGAFATLTLAILDGASGETICLCAGGEPPLVLHANGTAETISVGGLVLGLLPDQVYTAVRLQLEPGDTLILVSDGLTEARRPAFNSPHSRMGAFLGLDGVAQFAMQAQSMSVSLFDLGRSVFENARDYSGGMFQDDASLLMGRREPR